MNSIRNLAVFCGSSPGVLPDYVAVARELGTLLAAKGIGLVYGGGNMGVMGELARSVMAGGGRVIGVIPERLNAMVEHAELSELIVVGGMHERKRRMYDLADAFVILPGGIGTMEEFFEVFTWQQLGYHQKAVGLLNIRGFFDPLLLLLDQLVASGFFKQGHREALLCAREPGEIVAAIQTAKPVYQPKLPERRNPI